MRIAVLSDIHANLDALDAVLARDRSVDAVWYLGDVVGYGPQPERRRRAGAGRQARVGVRGNHDSAALGELEIGEFNPDARGPIEWTAGEHLTPDPRLACASVERRTSRRT